MKQKIYFLALTMLAVLISCKKTEENGIGATKHGSCWCTEGVAHKLDLVHYRDAGLWNEATLAPAGQFYRTYSPQINSVAVFKGGYHSSAAGHVAFVKKIVAVTDGYTVTFWGTNQTSNETLWNNECGCDNFNDWTFKVTDDDISSGNIRFYKEDNPVFECGSIFSSGSVGGGGAGTAPVPTISISGNLSFGNVQVGQPQQKIFSISAGQSPLTVTSVIPPAGYSCSYSGTIQPGQPANIYVTFSPSSAQPYLGNIIVMSNAVSGNNSIPVAGYGVNAAPVPTQIISVTGNLNFGNVTVGQSRQLSFSITNLGNTSFYVNSVSVPSKFSCNYNGTIQPGQTVPVDVTFSPTSAQTYSGNVQVNSTATSGNYLLQVSGTGINSSAGSTPTSVVPALNVYTVCGPTTNGVNACGLFYQNGIVHSRITGINSNGTLQFQISKCDGTAFGYGGSVVIKQNDICGTTVGSASFNAGQSTVNISANPTSVTGMQGFIIYVTQPGGYSYAGTVTAYY